MSSQGLTEYGWDAVPRDRSNVPSADEAAAPATDGDAVDITGIWHDTELTRKAREYVQHELHPETYNHSLRVYAYGYQMVRQHFPDWVRSTFFETWALTCLFHDIGTTPQNMSSTHMSFEFQGGFIALTKLQEFGAPKIQAESVAEAIIRHQDPGETGTISAMGQLIQIATEFDNMGWQPHLVSREVIEAVIQQLPRLGWSNCFSNQIQKEIEQKPWCHTTAIPNFAEAVAGNELMRPYE
ncbi:cyanamide hydratase [Alternaria panax]|uniref:Cyanamide hydratase n=1 Tax=Alternaria panax TaxID=48097 RepID=A0AAD4I979_9PLEO|nr:cyanamide hydratase [Alternaria panax]